MTHFNNSVIMHYTEYFTVRDCSGFLQIRSHMYMMYACILLELGGTQNLEMIQYFIKYYGINNYLN